MIVEQQQQQQQQQWVSGETNVDVNTFCLSFWALIIRTDGCQALAIVLEAWILGFGFRVSSPRVGRPTTGVGLVDHFVVAPTRAPRAPPTHS